MYSVVERLYKSRKIDSAYLDIAIKLGWITGEEKEQIVSSQWDTFMH